MSNTRTITEKDFYVEFDEDNIENLIEEIIGKGKKFTYTVKEKNNEAFHLDSLLFLEICAQNDETISAVVKKMKKASVKNKFKNELFMYKSVIQTLSRDFQSIFPKVIYASPVSDSDNMVIAFEDLTQIGFKMAPGKVKMDVEEIRISLKALGKFHAEMYTMKLTEPELFSKATKFINMNNAQFVINNDPLAMYAQNMREQSVLKTFARLMRNNNHNEKVKTFYNFIQKNAFKDLCLKALEPEEPIAVICHGDYNRHNLMFRYEDGLPVECKVIDLQTPSYGSPSIDIGFILFMNMESSDRLKHWDSLWRHYHDALQESLLLNMGENFVIPSFLSLESLLKDFRRKCFYPFIISLYFTSVNFCDMDKLFKLIGEYFEIDAANVDSRIKQVRQCLEIIETEEVVRINDELALEYVDSFEDYLDLFS